MDSSKASADSETSAIEGDRPEAAHSAAADSERSAATATADPDPEAPSVPPLGAERIVLRRYGLVVAGVVALVCYGLAYTLSFRQNIIWENQFEYVPLIEKYFEGTLTFEDLWLPFGEHRLLGYKLLFLANAVWFELNSPLEAALMPISLGIGALVLFWSYRNSLPAAASDRFKQLSFLVLAVVFIGINQYASFGNGMIVGLAIGSTLFVIAFMLLDRFLQSPTRRTLAWYAGAVLAAVLLFGSAYSTGFAVSVLGTLAAVAAIQSRTARRLDTRTLGLAVAPVVVGMAVYMAPFGGSPVSNASLSENLPWVLARPAASLRFVWMMLTNTVLNEDVYLRHTDRASLFVVFGAGLMLLYGYALWTFARTRVGNVTWVPLALIVHGLATTFMVLIGRSRMGADYAVYQQYLLQTKLGLIGVLWILFLRWQTAPRTSARIAIAAAGAVLSGQVYTNWVEWQIVPYRKDLFERGLNATLFDEDSLLRLKPGQEYNDLLALPQETDLGLDIAKKYALSAFDDCPVPGRTLADAILLSGWHSLESGASRWISRSAVAMVQTGQQGSVAIDGYVSPEVFDAVYGQDLELAVSTDIAPPVTTKLAAGPFQIRLSACKACTVRVRLQPSKFFVPQNTGMGPDDRELSILITNLLGE